jgi:PKD repeat protein
MKKIYLISGLLMVLTQAFCQTVPRNMVVLEVSTGTWCTYCPGAANAADQLVAEGKSVAVIEYHDGDPFANAASDARNIYYSISGYPTGHFDGTSVFVGGAACPSGNVYSNYLPLYDQEIATAAPMNICLSGSNSGNNYTVNISLTKVGTITGNDLRLHLVLTESDIQTSPWPGSGCMTEVNFVERLMVPDQNGTAFSFTSGNVQNFTLNFTKDPSWVAANCEIVAFVQDNPTRQIYNGCKSALATLPGAMMTLTDFTATPTTGCTPLPVNFTSVTTGVTAYSWTFPGGTPGTSTLPNPAVTYSGAGNFNVGLTGSNGVCKDSIGKTAYIVVSGTPGIPGTPTGNTSMCINPPDQSYNTSGGLYATSYNWDLSPASAGVVTNNGTNCTINWDNTYMGTAVLKVQGVSTCGTGPWSGMLSISLNQVPTQAGTPAGPTLLCSDPPSSDYTTTGGSPATSYIWELTPTSAGSITSYGTNATVDWSATFTGTAQLKVSAFNGGCQGPWSVPLDITVNQAPSAYNITGGGPYCAIGGTGIPVGLDGSQGGISYTLYLDGIATTTVVTGTGSAISFGNQMTAGTYTADGANVATSCTTGMNGNAVVEVDPQVPDVPAMPTGPDQVYSGSTPTSDYSTEAAQYSRSYTWELTPSLAGTITGGTTTCTVTWDPSYVGIATVKVQGVNTCGGSSFSVEFPVTVDNGVGIADLNRKGSVNIFPNPAKGYVNISTQRPLDASITVTNSLGAVLIARAHQYVGAGFTLDIRSLSPGVYFLNLNGSEINQTVKLMVN